MRFYDKWFAICVHSFEFYRRFITSQQFPQWLFVNRKKKKGKDFLTAQMKMHEKLQQLPREWKVGVWLGVGVGVVGWWTWCWNTVGYLHAFLVCTRFLMHCTALTMLPLNWHWLLLKRSVCISDSTVLSIQISLSVWAQFRGLHFLKD